MEVVCECGNPIVGPAAFELRAGEAEAEEWIQEGHGYHVLKHKFLADEFQDGVAVRYLCEECARDHTVFMFRFRSADGRPPEQCPLCERPVDSTMEVDPTRLIQIKFGLFGRNKCGALHFAAQQIGYVCEDCAWTELDLPFGNLHSNDDEIDPYQDYPW